MDHLLATSGWKAIHSDAGQYDLLRKQVVLYSVVENTEAWKDFMFRLAQLRAGTRDAIERGFMDKFGKTHEPEQRAVLYAVDQLLGYLPAIHMEHERLMKIREAEEARANLPLYGEDRITDLTDGL